MSHTIRVPLNMIQLTEPCGKTWPIAFDWQDDDGATIRVSIDRILDVAPAAELKSGVAGDRYECEIEGRLEYLYYAKLSPRKWFRLVEVGEKEYADYYALPKEGYG